MNIFLKLFCHLNSVIKIKSLIILFSLIIPSFSYAKEDISLIKAKEGFLITVARFESAILKLNKHLDKKKATRLATLIAIESKKQNIDPRIFLAIINTESSFNQKAVSSTGDVSLAQINPKAWNSKIFKQKIGYDFDLNRVKKEEAYAVSRMGLILSYLKTNFSKHDKWWFARYHSATPEFKKIYISRLIKSFKTIKPFGRDLLKDMPSIEQISKFNLKEDVYFAKVNLGGKFHEVD